MLLTSCLAALALAVSASATQQFFSAQSPANFQSYDAGLFTPLEDLSLLSKTDFTTLSHPLFPNYSVRIKKSDFCDETVASYTGYIDIQARHFFFYFFESRNDPATDDIIYWTAGGPGCSSSLELFMEFGPCRVTDVNTTTFNPYSWNERANIFFVDQPVNVGFSYAEFGEVVSTTTEAAKDMAAFTAIFFEHFSQFKGRAFHVGGASYGGRYIPVFASEVYDQNARLIEAGLTPINLTSILIGNGCTDPATMTASYYDMACRPMPVDPILDISTCVRMKQAVGRCEKMMKESCVDKFEAIGCQAASVFCGAEIEAPFDASGYNPYDISKPCDGVVSDNLCYPLSKTIEKYLSRPVTRASLGVDAVVPEEFQVCNNDVNSAFHVSHDHMFPTQFYIAALLERGIRTLLYIGVNDWICNWVGNDRMVQGMEWTGQQAFVDQPLREWSVDGQVAGLTRSAGPLTFLTLDNAGHMPAYDTPKAAQVMLQRWLAGEEM
ncbi:uncharacterized protein FIBRA_02649 [Fibroporia radiculosa]|uniref:carboxypeptidase C n=1 Tax=Fibroporia radiculosa TaxID=599839 RepID=J4G271_9APHY|nr:uncharacterized protein FIBRA_02649 [Fibroporia radiculosa]CCM00613.1 predicted protein [Fibroporia radiculosa]